MNIIKSLFKILPQNIVSAHCDIPCGIYDPHMAQVAAHTVIRMTQLLLDLKREDEIKAEHDIARITKVKEDHTAIFENELFTLKNDYFKEEHFQKNPDLNNLFSETFKLITKSRQGIDIETSEKALANAQKIAEIFFKTKNLEFLRAPSGFPTGGEIVVQK